jgi:hypothetical protein
MLVTWGRWDSYVIFHHHIGDSRTYHHGATMLVTRGRTAPSIQPLLRHHTSDSRTYRCGATVPVTRGRTTHGATIKVLTDVPLVAPPLG